MTEQAQVDVRDPQLRIERILDSGTFTALTERDDSGMLAGYGYVSGTRVTVFATDATIQGGAMGEGGAHVILAAYADAMKHKNPIVGIWWRIRSSADRCNRACTRRSNICHWT